MKKKKVCKLKIIQAGFGMLVTSQNLNFKRFTENS